MVSGDDEWFKEIGSIKVHVTAEVILHFENYLIPSNSTLPGFFGFDILSGILLHRRQTLSVLKLKGTVVIDNAVIQSPPKIDQSFKPLYCLNPIKAAWADLQAP